MAAELRGTEFTIDPKGRQDQVIPPEGFTEWRWTVTPLSSGEKPLRFVVYIVLRLASGQQEDYQIVKDKLIPVRVNAPYQVGRFLSTYWVQISGLITIVFGSGFVWTVFNRRSERRKTERGENISQ
jgi:hypothetical protein